MTIQFNKCCSTLFMPMRPKAANERSGVKPEMAIMTYHRKAATQIYLSRVAGFFFLSFVPARLACRSGAKIPSRLSESDPPASRCLPARASQWQAGEALRAGGGRAETEKKKRKSCRSSKSCQIRKSLLIIEFLRRRNMGCPGYNCKKFSSQLAFQWYPCNL
jgi:hypothetical protein